jgi:glycine/D-amino acid oxidase-like deaminating enzyme
MSATTAPADWLDSCCWRCGSGEIAPSTDGRLLCGPCRHEVFDTVGAAEPPLRMVRRMYWESHALERCWRCMDRPVDPDDDLGLCSRCR